jgi:hypothetical protein
VVCLEQDADGNSLVVDGHDELLKLADKQGLAESSMLQQDATISRMKSVNMSSC